MKNVQAMIFDLDGTLLDGAGNWFVNAYEGLLQIKAKNIPMFIATGRSIRSLHEIHDPNSLLDLFHDEIACNYGNAIYNKKTEELLVLNHMPRQDIVSVYHQLAEFCEFVFEDSGNTYTNSKSKLGDEYVHRCLMDGFSFSLKRIDDMQEVSLDHHPFEAILEVIMLPHREQNQALLDKICAIEDNYPDLAFYYRDTDLGKVFYIRPKDTRKTKAVEALLTPYSFDYENIMVFGNDNHDLPLFERFGVGVAVQDSTRRLSQLATHRLEIGIGEYLLSLESLSVI